MHEREILLAALEKTGPDERAAYLTQACGTDLELRSRVDALLRASEVQDSFLEHPAAETELLSPETDGIRREIAEHEEMSLDFLQPSNEPNALGRLGTYEVFEVIGRGGMGVVLKARDTKLGRVVAIKVLASELASNPTARKRFQREAHAAAAVVHQHIVTIHAVDEERLPYLVMECIAGQSLKEKIDLEGHLQLVEILRIGQQVASGLAAAHAHGLIHRDVKPANILLENGVERVRITDFGLARAVDDVGMTRTGEVAGTPQYMSPEQAQGLPMDGRSDLFSFGCVLYAMCTGRPPFRAESAPAVLHRICLDTPRPIHEINPEIPNWLQGVIDRLLKKDPAERFQSAKEVAELLGQYLAHVQQPGIVPLPGKEPTSPARKLAVGRRQWSVALVASLLVLALALGLTEASGVTTFVPTVIRIVRGEGTLVIEVADPTVQVSLDGEELSIRGAGLKELKLFPGKYRLHAKKDGRPVKDEVVTITRDGRKVVTVTLEGSSGSGSTGSVPAAEPTAAEELKLLAKLEGHTDVVRGLAFLPDGRRMVSVDRLIRIWDLPTRSVTSTLPLEGYWDADVSADGRLVAVLLPGDAQAVARVWDIEKREVVCQFAPERNTMKNVIRFSPDGTRLVTTGFPLPNTVLWDTATGRELRRFDVDATSGASEAAFSPDGQMLAVSGIGRVRLFDFASGNVVADVRLPSNRYVSDLVFAPSGKTLATAEHGGHVSLIDVESRRVIKTLQGFVADVCSVRYLGNDSFLLTSSRDAILRVWDLEHGRVVAQAATENGMNDGLFVSPDGRQVITAGGKQWDAASKSTKDYGDYALRLWQLPESVWAKKVTGAASTKEPANASSEPGAFVLLGAGTERKFDTLTEAIQSTSSGDTIEIRGNGPFVSDGVIIARPLVIRAGKDYSPSIALSQAAADKNTPLLKTSVSLVLEGMELKGIGIAKGPVARFPPLVHAWGPGELQVTNCRLVFGGGGGLINSNFSVCNLRNCQFNTTGLSAVDWKCPPGGRGTIENCVSAVGGLMNLNLRGPSAKDVLVEIRSNTTIESCLCLGFDQAQRPTAPPIHLNFCANVTQCPSNLPRSAILRVDQAFFEPSLSPQDAETLLGALVEFHEQHNVYLVGSRMLQHAIFKKITGTTFFEASQGRDLADWNRFWKQSDTGSVEEDVLFEGGDLRQKARANLQQLSAADFRLLESSAGYRAGEDGKDLGADVDLVGPGEAYERWKKTPEYQESLKQTGQIK